LGAKVLSNCLKLIDCDFDVDLLLDLDSAFGFLEHGAILSLFVQHVVEQLVNIVLLVLILA